MLECVISIPCVPGLTTYYSVGTRPEPTRTQWVGPGLAKSVEIIFNYLHVWVSFCDVGVTQEKNACQFQVGLCYHAPTSGRVQTKI